MPQPVGWGMSFKAYKVFVKFGIVVFVLLTGGLGYFLSFSSEIPFSWAHFLSLISGLYFISAGSLALNQIQDQDIDKLMNRTEGRPLVSGDLSLFQANIIVISHLVLGVLLLGWVSELAAMVSIASVILYNVLYTMWWKRKWVFGAVPGAVPGALPFVIGYAANSNEITSLECIYGFLIMFFWQMPHFWALAIKYKDDYSKAGVPVLPAVIGVPKTLYHTGLYVYAYCLLAAASPFLVKASWFYLVLVLPVVGILVRKFHSFAKADGEKHWLGFFLWTNASMLLFLFVPVFDKWVIHQQSGLLSIFGY
jgi:protoheme IX farnesyltransferase